MGTSAGRAARASPVGTAVGGTTFFGLVNTLASGTGGAAFGNGAWATGEHSTAVGHNSYADGDDSAWMTVDWPSLTRTLEVLGRRISEAWAAGSDAASAMAHPDNQMLGGV